MMATNFLLLLLSDLVQRNIICYLLWKLLEYLLLFKTLLKLVQKELIPIVYVLRL